MSFTAIVKDESSRAPASERAEVAQLAAIARVCLLNRVPCLSIKCISDTYEGDGGDFAANVERSAGRAFAVLRKIMG